MTEQKFRQEMRALTASIIRAFTVRPDDNSDEINPEQPQDN